MDLAQLMVDSRRIAAEHGFVTTEANIPEKLMLITSELAEALEEYRGDVHGIRAIYASAGGKPEGFAVELADALIRIVELAEALQLPLITAIKVKQEYNEQRPMLHNKRF